MKATGIVRKIDSLGRIVLPIELRRELGIHSKDMIEILVEDEYIILKQYHQNCCLCGECIHVLNEYRGKLICNKCLNKIQAFKINIYQQDKQ